MDGETGNWVELNYKTHEWRIHEFLTYLIIYAGIEAQCFILLPSLFPGETGGDQKMMWRRVSPRADVDVVRNINPQREWNPDVQEQILYWLSYLGQKTYRISQVNCPFTLGPEHESLRMSVGRGVLALAIDVRSHGSQKLQPSLFRATVRSPQRSIYGNRDWCSLLPQFMSVSQSMTFRSTSHQHAAF